MSPQARTRRTAKLDYGERNLLAALRRHAEERPQGVFLIDDDGALTWEETLSAARAAASGWRALGVERGQTIALMLENRRELLIGWFGLCLAGALEVPVNPDYVGARLTHVLNHSRSRLLVVDAEHLPRIDSVADELETLERLVVIGEAESERFETVRWEEVATAEPEAADLAVRFSDPAAVMYTSGSTGPAKGVVLSHGQHYMNGYQAASVLDLTPDDRLYLCLPLHHNMAQGYVIWAALASGASVRLARRFSRRSFWADVTASEATVLPFIGALLLLLAELAPSDGERAHRLRAGYGVPIPRDLHEPLEERFGLRLVHGYGSTEATIVAWTNPEDPVPGAAGPPLEEYEVTIVDDDDIPVPQGERGEICIRSREPYSMFLEYFRDPARTVEAWRNLWFHTGDRGWIDERGNLWFSDRRGDVIRRMGEFIDSWEVEQAALGHDAVAAAAAYGVPSELSEEEVMIAVVAREGAPLDALAVQEWCAKRLPRFAVPRFVTILEELPMTTTGKVEKYKLKQAGVTPDTFDARASAGSLGETRA